MIWIAGLLAAGLLVVFLLPVLLARRQKGKTIPGNLAMRWNLGTSYTGLVYIWGRNCAHCRTMAPVVDEAISAGKPIRKIQVDEDPSGPLSLGIMSVPTTILVEKGTIRSLETGAKNRSQLEQYFQQLSIN